MRNLSAVVYTKQGTKNVFEHSAMAKALFQEGLINQTQLEEITHFVNEFASLNDKNFDGATISKMVHQKRIIVDKLLATLAG